MKIGNSKLVLIGLAFLPYKSFEVQYLLECFLFSNEKVNENWKSQNNSMSAFFFIYIMYGKVVMHD